MKFKVQWLDRGREPQCAPDPNFPNGKDVDASEAAPGEPTCKAELPYPAKRCGVYVIECETCGVRVGVTTAGRPDDPRSARFPCKRKA